jgi:formylglycine-generating enzyme required for sulfatase activity
MKHFLLTLLLALAASSFSNAQTLQVDPIYIGGTAAFEVQGGTPGGVAIVCYSINGTGPFTLANGLSLDLSMPIKQLSPMVLNGIGAGYLGPFPTPSSAIVGMQVWFQAVDVNIWGSQILSATNMVPITVQNMPNNPPTAVDDNANTRESVAVTIDVMANDSDIDGDGISLFSVSTPANGIAVINGGLIDYTPNTLFFGVDTFTYQLQDAPGAQDTATVTVTVTANNAPLAVDDNASVTENGVVLIDVLVNDSDPDGDTISLVSLTAPTNGSAVIANGQIEYTPLVNYLGVDSFTYVIEDSFAAQATATVYMGVGPFVHMVAIPGGTFEMGDHVGLGWAEERPVHSVTLDAFYMDKYEVSNTKFADFLNNSTVIVSGGAVYQVGGAGQQICYLNSGLTHNGSAIFVINAGKEHHPVVYQTWYGAALYCNYLSTLNGRTPCYDETTFACDFTVDGFRLPTEAEWEYASRGGEHSPYYQYPWGSDTITSLDANYGPYIGTTVDVGSYAANGYGLYDMAGNVWEWCNDWYDYYYYSNSPSTNPTGPANGSDRVLRGGSWGGDGIQSRCAQRSSTHPTDWISGYIGFRVLAVQ